MSVFDVILLLLLVGAFFLGFFQGGVRLLLVLLAWLASFLLAANLRGPVGGFLGGYWTQYSADYVPMLAFLILFVVFFVLAVVAIEIVYRRPPALSRFPILDEVGGGVLGLAVGFLVLAALITILDSFYASPSATGGGGEVGLLRDLQTALGSSGVTNALRGTLLPVLGTLLGLLLPGDVATVMRT